LLALAGGPLLDPDPRAGGKHQAVPGERVLTHWGPFLRVDVIAPGDSDDLRVVLHDGVWSTSLVGHAGGAGRVEPSAAGRNLAYLLVPRPQRVAVLAPGDGSEVRRALARGAREVIAVEESPLTASLLSRSFATSARGPGDRAEGEFRREGIRSFVARHPEHFDVVELNAPRGHAAASSSLAAGTILPETRLLSVESLAGMVASLRPGGVLAAHFGEPDWEGAPLRTLRYLATVREALTGLGVADPTRHLAVVTTPAFGTLASVLVSRAPLGAAGLERFLAGVGRVPGAAVSFAGGWVFESGPVADFLRQREADLAGWRRRQPWSLAPVTDDRPFFWRFARRWGALPSYGRTDGRLRDALLPGLAGVALGVAIWLALTPPAPLREGFAGGRGRGLWLVLGGAGAVACQVAAVAILCAGLGDPLLSVYAALPASLAWASLGCVRSSRRPDDTVVWLLLLAGGAALLLGARAAFGNTILAAPPFARVLAAVAFGAPVAMATGACLARMLRTSARAGAVGGAGIAWASALLAAGIVTGSLLSGGLAPWLGLAGMLLLGGVALGAAAQAVGRLEPS